MGEYVGNAMAKFVGHVQRATASESSVNVTPAIWEKKNAHSARKDAFAALTATALLLAPIATERVGRSKH